MHTMRTPPPLLLALILSTVACGPVTSTPTTTGVTSEGPSTGMTTAGPATGQTTSTTSSSASTNATQTSSSTTGTSTGFETCGDFVCIPDAPPPDCDIFEQDCPRGQKCQGYDLDGDGFWDSRKCVPIIGDGMLDDPCKANPISEGGDDCAKGYLCWHLDDDLNGTCVGVCTGSDDNPSCEHECTYCVLSADPVIAPCLPGCDPLAPDCGDSEVCIGNPMNDGFFCVLDASGGMAPVGTPCEFANVCNPGLHCEDSQEFPYPGCEESIGCCAPFCDLTEGEGDQNPTCQALAGDVPGVECVPWFDEAPEACPGDVGSCRLPQP